MAEERAGTGRDREGAEAMEEERGKKAASGQKAESGQGQDQTGGEQEEWRHRGGERKPKVLPRASRVSAGGTLEAWGAKAQTHRAGSWEDAGQCPSGCGRKLTVCLSKRCMVNI